MTSSAPARTTCPRCENPLVRNHDVLECLVHGTIEEPVRAWDLPSVADVELEVGRARRRGASHHADAVPWTDEERRVWDEWKEGDPVPDAAPESDVETKGRRMGINGATTVSIQSAEQLAGACQARVDAIDRELALVDEMAGKLRDERQRLGQVVALLRGEKASAPAAKGTKRGPINWQPWRCPCGFEGTGRAVGKHKEVCGAWQHSRVSA